jgi:hypothetical protein
LAAEQGFSHRGKRQACQSPGYCKDLPITISDESFTLDCFSLALGSYDLDVQWLESLGPILWDFTARTIVFVQNGHRVCWQATEPATGAPPLLSINGKVLEDLMHHFDGVFATPVGLPSVHPYSHQIRLLPGTALVAVRPYRYAHLQKEELESQCTNMLHQSVIRSSSSAFPAPVLLVKKQDGSWRFCVDYRALNSMTVKDKFAIPIIEELLDEPCGTTFFTKLDLRSGYHQVQMHDADVEKTTFHTHQGLFEFLLHKAGPTVWLPSSADARRRRGENDVPHPPRALRVPCHAIQLDKRASHLPGKVFKSVSRVDKVPTW